jgi:NAD(P)-dependent dehydrogenase (short-subunit alcohol dehydrogenase family)
MIGRIIPGRNYAPRLRSQPPTPSNPGDRRRKFDHMAPPRRSVLVTGASSGIGLATARLLADHGFHVLAGVRAQRGWDALVELQSSAIEPVWLDVTSDEQVRALADDLGGRLSDGLFALVNNAGIGPPAAVELSALDEVRRVLEVNTLAPLRMIQAFLPLLRRGRGRIVNMSSMNGTLALPMVGVYSASKFALEALGNTLRVELRPWNIPITVIRPGQVSTPIFDKARLALERGVRELPAELKSGYAKLYARAARFNERGARIGAPPQVVAAVVLKALRARRPRPAYAVGLDVRGLHLAQALMPTRWLDGMLALFAGANRSERRQPSRPESPPDVSDAAAPTSPR